MSTPEQLREGNRARLVDALRRHRRASRAELARMTGLSRTTVVSIVEELQARGLIVEQPQDAVPTKRRGRGRPPVPVRLHAAAGVAIGVAVGRREVRAAVADL